MKMEFKEFVEARMRKVGIPSFRQLAIKMGAKSVNSGGLTRVLKNPTYSMMVRIASALDCELWELLKPPCDDGVDYEPEKPREKVIDRIFIGYADGSVDRFTKDPDVFD